jgi:hypothetical protein
MRCADVLSVTYLSFQTPSPADFSCSFSIIICWLEIKVFTKVYTRNGRIFGESTRISMFDRTSQRHVKFSALAFYSVLHYAYKEFTFSCREKFGQHGEKVQFFSSHLHVYVPWVSVHGCTPATSSKFPFSGQRLSSYFESYKRLYPIFVAHTVSWERKASNCEFHLTWLGC